MRRHRPSTATGARLAGLYAITPERTPEPTPEQPSIPCPIGSGGPAATSAPVQPTERYGAVAVQTAGIRTTSAAILADQAAQAIAGGARLIQYRNKGGDPAQRLQEAEALRSVCRAAAVPFIVNDDVALAAHIGADGVHLGRGDADPAAARERLGPDALIGVSCYDSLERAIHAQAVGADYVAFGRFFPSRTKPLATPATTELLCRAREILDIPLVAIGGITPDNGGILIAAGADMLAAIDAVFGRADIRAAAAAFASLFHAAEPSSPTLPTDVSDKGCHR